MLALLRALVSVEGVDVAKAGLSAVSKSFESTASVASGVFSASIHTAINVIGTLTAVTAGATIAVSGLAATMGTETALKFDSLARGLASVSKDAGDLAGQIDRLREVAKLPGLGFEEAVAGSLALQSAGLSAQTAERALMSFGNALAISGKGKAELEGVVLALQQIASKGKVSAEEINQLNERLPQIRKAMQAAFGTSDTEALGKMGVSSEKFIGGIIAQFEKLPKATGGAQNAIDNFGDSLKTALQPLGQGVLEMFSSLSAPMDTMLRKIGEIANAIGEVFSAIGRSGTLSSALGALFGGDSGASGIQDRLIRVASVAIAVIGNIRGAFATLAYNARETWSFVSSLFSNLLEKSKILVEAIKAPVLALMATIKAFAGVLGTTLFLTSSLAKTLFGAATGGIAEKFAQVDKNMPVNLPQFQKFGNLTEGAGLIESQIRGNLRPLAKLPEDLLYGGKSASEGLAQQASSTVWAQWDKYLAGIEKNTARTADAITSRRTSGGGELARMGISGAELRKQTAARNSRVFGRA